MQGWIKLHRKIIEHPLYYSEDHKMFKFWMMILLSVNHAEKRVYDKDEEVIIKSGQKLTSIDSLLDMFNYRGERRKERKDKLTFQTCRTYLKRLEKWGMIKQYTTNKYRIIEVVNWRLYQDTQNTKLTGDQQATNKQLTTNKNVKNDKEIYSEYKYFDDTTFKKSYMGFRSMRRAMRNVPYTNVAEKTILNKLHKVDIKTAISMLEVSTERGYRSVFPPKEGQLLKKWEMPKL